MTHTTCVFKKNVMWKVFFGRFDTNGWILVCFLFRSILLSVQLFRNKLSLSTEFDVLAEDVSGCS